ncbi:uncharacterized protein LOC142344978 [Convolutriloba macropyga]|uniref:uncharacterized protein LOC142344978 n=1 Tax=Convolutriloba macropyga TaxID=536237 RepID=UPI003F51F778
MSLQGKGSLPSSGARGRVSSGAGEYTIDETAEDVNLSLDISSGDASDSLTDPEILLDDLARRYRCKKNMYRRASECYFNLNSFVFFFPILLLTGVATVLTHIATVMDSRRSEADKNAADVRTFAITVSCLSGVCLIWHSFQMRLRWVEKTSLAESAMKNYRSLLLLIDHLRLLLRVQQHPRSTAGILTVVKSCYEEEQKVLKNDASVPACVYRDYRNEKFASGDQDILAPRDPSSASSDTDGGSSKGDEAKKASFRKGDEQKTSKKSADGML